MENTPSCACVVVYLHHKLVVCVFYHAKREGRSCTPCPWTTIKSIITFAWLLYECNKHYYQESTLSYAQLANHQIYKTCLLRESSTPYCGMLTHIDLCVVKLNLLCNAMFILSYVCCPTQPIVACVLLVLPMMRIRAMPNAWLLVTALHLIASSCT